MVYILKTNKFQILSIVLILVFWSIFANIVNNPIKIPSPYLTFTEMVKIVSSDTFLLEISSTLLRVFKSFVLAFALGLSLGMLSGFNKIFYYLLNPVILVLKSMPTIAVILLSLIWLGREISPILVAFLIAFPVIYTSVLNGIRNIDKKLLDMTEIYKFSKKKKFFHLYLPSIRSSLIAISKTSLSLALKVCIAAEVLSQPKNSIGTSFQIEKVALNTAGVLAWAIIVIILAGIIDLIITKLVSIKSNK